MIPFIITNYDIKKIEVISEYDEKCKIMRIDVKEKKNITNNNKRKKKENLSKVFKMMGRTKRIWYLKKLKNKELKCWQT